MPAAPRLSQTHKDLIRRYLTWGYKSTKESFDRLERKTTQLMADKHILAALSKSSGPRGEGYDQEVQAFKEYVADKRQQKVPAGKHAYFRDRLKAVESAIVHFLGRRDLNAIKRAYEQEFTRRIWESKDH